MTSKQDDKWTSGKREKLVVLLSGTLKDSGKVEKLKSEKGQKNCLINLSAF